MSEETTQTEAKTEAPKMGRPAKGVKVENTSSRPITLIAGKNDKETILPTQTKELKKDFMEKIRGNKAAMTFFESKELKEV